MLRFLFALAAVFASLGAAAQTACPARLFVSGYFSTVHVFDACTGAYLRDLDGPERIAGPQAVRLGPDGLLYVVSEETSTILKYRNDTLAHAGEFVRTGPTGPTGLAFDAAGTAYVGGYRSHDVRRYAAAGAAGETVIAARAAGLRGPDNGLVFGPDGNLYVPGYDSHNVVRWDPRTGLTQEALAAGAGGIVHTRGLLPGKSGSEMFITAEGSGRLLRWDLASGALTVLRSGLARPTGLAWAPDGNLLVVDGPAVVRIDPATGNTLSTLVAGGAGGVSGPVFLAVVPVAAAATGVDAAQVGTQYWVVGDAAFAGRVLDVRTVYSATGTAFGAALRFQDITLRRWGSVRLELVSCTRAHFAWDSSGTDSARFGSGAYEVERYFANEATRRCEQQGVDGADRSWVNGMWWGGEARAGEGLFLDRREDGTTFFAWFTHRPRE